MRRHDILGVARGPVQSVSAMMSRIRRGERTLQCNRVLPNRLDGRVGDDSLAALEDRGDADLLPLNRDLRNA